jgi:hypothetical protein
LRTAALLLLAALLLAPGDAVAQQAADPAAQRAADQWLQLVDSGQYGLSWDGAAALFKGAIGRDQWIAAVTGARRPLGPLKERKLQSATATRTLPGAPDGDYVVLQYETSFENKPRAVETVTPMREADGQWKVSGYYVR